MTATRDVALVLGLARWRLRLRSFASLWSGTALIMTGALGWSCGLVRLNDA
jgi:hypothetical protein